MRLVTSITSRTMDNKFRCHSIDSEKFDENGLSTDTSEEQMAVEHSISKHYENFKAMIKSADDKLVLNNFPKLNRDVHLSYLKKGLRHLSESYECLDASRPWLCYWVLHSLELLDYPISDDVVSQVSVFLSKCQCPTGGFAGGPGQEAHLAPTYAAVNALCILGTEEAYKVINRKTLHAFLMKMRSVEGAFKMHEGGEVDIRGAYCAATVAKLTNVITVEMFDGTPEWIVSCQSYEGGFGGCPGMEAHGGYSFCGLAALTLLGHTKLCDIDRVLRWTANRQMRFEGGFQGRTNKLVDGCYSFWQGGAFPLIHMILAIEDKGCLSAENWMCHQNALQEYILLCCQHLGGGLVDKPGKNRDFYHTCYCLSGLSIAQHFAGGKLGHLNVVGNEENQLRPTHPVFNISVEAVVHATLYYNKLHEI